MPRFALFNYGFRPFFLLSGLFALMALGYFVCLTAGLDLPFFSRLDPIQWHQHEMTFGYGMAVVTGFLFTAVANWTGHKTPRGGWLGLIVAAWIMGRIAVFASDLLPLWLAALMDAGFSLLVIAGIAPALIKGGNKRNFFFIVLLLLLGGANLLMWLGYGVIGFTAGLNILLLMIVIIGGRVMPMFTERPLGLILKRDPRIDRITLITTVLALTGEVISLIYTSLGRPILGIFFLLAALSNLWRLSQWQSLKTLKLPLVWVLHAAYGWIIIGFALKGFIHLGMDIWAGAATHALTVGGLGVMTLGFMARVALGHTGRPLVVGLPMTIAFIALNLAAVLRALVILVFPDQFLRLAEAAGALWLVAFVLFLWVYVPILIAPRADGRPD